MTRVAVDIAFAADVGIGICKNDARKYQKRS